MHEILNGKTVLVVDDTANIRVIVSDVLGRTGMRVLEADCAEQAIQIAGEQSIDAFLLDLKLPDMNGFELCRALRAIDRYRGAPIIFVSAVDQREILPWALEAGCDDFIHKPIHAMVLRARLGNLLQKAAYLRQVELMSLSLQRYVSPRTEEIAKIYATTGVLPAPRQQEVCVLFSDVRGFTEMSQEMEPGALFDVLSEQLSAQVGLVYKHGGYVDKFAGDGMMAAFDGEDMALKCCLCALDILDMSRNRAAREASKISQVGIGIHKGLATIGNLGSAEHFDYTLVGRTVNLAARLCGIADLSIVASQAVRDALGDSPKVRFRAQRLATIRGFKEPISVYEIERWET